MEPRNYVLSSGHLRGRHKARVFNAVLDMTEADAEELRQALLHAAATAEARPTESDDFGRRYVVDFELMRHSGQAATIRSGWIIRTGEDRPRFVTCFVL